MALTIKDREDQRASSHPYADFTAGIGSGTAFALAIGICLTITTAVAPQSWASVALIIALCGPVLLAHNLLQNRYHPQTRTSPFSNRLGRAASIVAFGIVAVLFVSPSADAQSADSLKTGDIEISDGIIKMGGMTVGDGCVKLDGETQVGDCEDVAPGEPGAEPPAKTLEDAADECENPAPEDTQETTALPTKEECDQIDQGLDENPEEPAEETTEDTTEDTTSDNRFDGDETPEQTSTEQQPTKEEPSGRTDYEDYLDAAGDDACILRDDVDDLRRVTVTSVVDGDTIRIEPAIDDTDTVRLIGVDTPETVDPNTDPEPYGKEASEYTTSEMEGEEIFLEIGEETTDKYGRLLAHPWTADATLFSEELLATGHAELLIIEPNNKYEDCLSAAESHARESNLGLWAESKALEPEQPNDTVQQDPPEGPQNETTTLEQTNPPEADEQTVEESTVQPTTEETNTDEPGLEETTVEETTVEDTTVEEKTVEETTVEEPSLEETSTDNFGAAPETEDTPEVSSPAPEMQTPDPVSTFGLQEELPTSSLPTQSTPTGEEPVLPDTSGIIGLRAIVWYALAIFLNLGMLTALYVRDSRRETKDPLVRAGRH